MNRPDDLYAMTHPSCWPCWPTLPVKNNRNRQPGQFPRLGVLVSTLEDPATDIRFVEGNAFMLTPEELADAPKADITQLISDGWVVD